MMFLEQAQTVAELQDHYRKVRQRLSNSLHQQPLPAKAKPVSAFTFIGPNCDHHMQAWQCELMQRKIDDWRLKHILAVQVDNSPDNNWPRIDAVRQANMIVEEVARVQNITALEMRSSRRAKCIVYARFEAIWRIYRATEWSLPQIGRFFGNRDHTSILHAIRAYEKRAFGADYKSHRLKPVIDHRAARANGGAA